MKRRTLYIIGAVVVVALAAVAYALFNAFAPADTTPVVTGVPTAEVNSIDARRTAQSRTQTAEAQPTTSGSRSAPSDSDSVQRVVYMPEGAGSAMQQTEPLYESCTALRLQAPERPTPAATTETPTEEPTPVATEDTRPTPTIGAPDLIRLAVIGEESEACYVVPEVFPGVGEFRIAVGVTRSIDGEVEIDRANIANSLVGDLTVNINEFVSDESRRDGVIRQNFIETNRFPFAYLRNIETIGLPQRAYIDGETVDFEIKGMLQVREVERETTFDASATLTGDLLVVRAQTTILMTDFGFDPPNVGFVQTDDEMQVVLNLVLRAVN